VGEWSGRTLFTVVMYGAGCARFGNHNCDVQCLEQQR
jgi:hypothetical protein